METFMDIKPVNTFKVGPNLPEELKRLEELAYNLWWSWNWGAVDLFQRLEPKLWEEFYHNPVKVIGNIPQERLEELAADQEFLAQLDRVWGEFQEYMSAPTWYGEDAGEPLIAYFSMEFGITECLPFYSGGLGMLSGDHLKSASDLGLPLVGVGLLYQLGYFKQYLNVEGWQGETYPVNDFYNMPLILETDSGGSPVKVSVEMPGRVVHAQVWRVQVGRVPLYLLDTNIPENSWEDRGITAQLYGGDREMRIKQEILLGMGGVRALRALGIDPKVYHMNEGHSAFSALERIRNYMEGRGLSYPEAFELTRAGNVFTTHTPVPAGIDVFPHELIDKYFSSFYELIPRETFLALGSPGDGAPDGEFSMAVLALKLSAGINGVSRLHGRVSRSLWKDVWPGVPVDEVPITHITNGVHYRTWVSREMSQLFDRYLGPAWARTPHREELWEGVDRIPEKDLWESHERRRQNLVELARKRFREQLRMRGMPRADQDRAETVLDPRALTIGFARRFAAYKRATLILRDRERLKRILSDPQRPVQLIFAGKAHPQDQQGKDIIKEVIHITRDPDFWGKVVFIADYDAFVARQMVKGCDIWLATPLRNLEASGTSGMKAAANGILNMGTLDGWWDEAYDPEVGWAVGKGEVYEDQEYQDEVESNAIYDLLEKEVVPLFYARDEEGIPRGWIHKMKASMKELCPVYCTDRMLIEYYERLYRPALERYNALADRDMEKARALAAWKERVRKAWDGIRIGRVSTGPSRELKVGTELHVEVEVELGELSPEDVAVEVYYGRLDHHGGISGGRAVTLAPEEVGDGTWRFTGRLICIDTGLFGY
ncbi:MAG: glycosyltransferase family 1 protein, partial [Euryarchaeota archaeon]|nr:glycosyltransferase family 1 protein [Euryarchaeota archaeon]